VKRYSAAFCAPQGFNAHAASIAPLAQGMAEKPFRARTGGTRSPKTVFNALASATYYHGQFRVR